MKDCIRIIICLVFLCCHSFASLAQNSPICFAWLSDTHVGSATGAEDLRAAVRDVNSIDDIEFVILSGDITEMGSNRELERAKAILDSLNKPYYIIPGNHDTKWSESGCTKFSEIWGDDKFQFEYKGYRFIGLHQGPLMRMGDGHFSPEDLHWLDSILVNLANPWQPLIFITHYPIDASVDNWYEFLDRVRNHQTKAILFGHGHRNKSYDLEGIPGVMGRSTLRGNRQSGDYNIVTIRHDSMFFYERLPISNLTSYEDQSINIFMPRAPCFAADPWHKLSLQRSKMDSNSAKFNRPDFSINRNYPMVKIRWLVETGYSITASPCVWKDRVIVGNRAGMIYGLSIRNGKKLWDYRVKASILSSPAADQERIVVASTNGAIYCLNVKNGRMLWQFPTGVPIVAAPQIYDDVVYIGSSDGHFRAIDLDNGGLLWEFSGVTGFVETRPLIYQDKVIFGAWDTYLYALNRSDGSLAWKWCNGNPGRLYSPAACWPVAAYKKIFIAAPDRFITAIDAKSGETVWRTGAHKVRESIGISQDGERIYARCMEDTLLAFSSRSEFPQLIWATSCDYGYDIAPSMPIEKSGVVFFSTKNGFVYAVDAITGKLKFQFRAGVTLINTVTPLDENRVIVADMDGRVMLIEKHR